MDTLPFLKDILSRFVPKKSLNHVITLHKPAIENFKSSFRLQFYDSFTQKPLVFIDEFKYNFETPATDPVSGFVWTDSNTKKFLYFQPSNTDIKRVWENARMHSSRFQDCTISQIINFVLSLENYLCFKVSPMEVSIRLCTLDYYIERKLDKFVLEDSQWRQLLDYYYEKLSFISKYDESHGTNTSNHHLANICGQVCILKRLAEANRSMEPILNDKLKSLYKIIDSQIHFDGAYFESSVNYGRFALEMIQASLTGISCPSEIIRKVERLSVWVSSFHDDAQNLLSFGDRDDGHFLPFSKPLERLFTEKKITFPYSKSKIVKTPGFNFFLWGCDYGQMNNGGHAHNDKGSFILYYKEQPLIIDPGTFCYSSNPRLRNLFRSASEHCVPLSNTEPRKIPKYLMFSFPDRESKPVINYYDEKNLLHVKMGTYEFSRNFKIVEGQFESTVHFEEKSWTISHLLHPSITPYRVNEYTVWLYGPKYIVEFKSSEPLKIEPTYYSRHYDAIQITLKIVCYSEREDLKIQLSLINQ